VPIGPERFATAPRADDRWGVLAFLLIMLPFALFAWVHSARVARRLPNSKLLATRGEVGKKTGTSEYGECYTLFVGGVVFHLAQSVFDAFADGGVYRVYYVAHVPVPIMLSFEPDEPDDGTTTHAHRARHRA